MTTSSTSFKVTGRSTGTTPLQLTGSAGAPIQSVTALDLKKKSPMGGTITEGSPIGTLSLPDPLFTTLVSESIPFHLALTGNDTGTQFIVSDIELVNEPDRAVSGFQSVSGAAALAEPLNHEAYAQIMGEFRALNKRMDSIERLLGNNPELHAVPTGT